MRTVEGHSEHVVVIGAGLAGLSAALHLAGRGRAVTVVERKPWPGGRAGRLDIDGYRIDTGPTVLTMPDIIDEAFAAVGENRSGRVDLLPVDPAYRAVFADGSALDVHSDADRMAAAIARVRWPGQAAGYRRLREWLKRLYRIEFDGFIAANFDSPLSLLTPQLARLAAIGGFRQVGSHGQAPHQRPPVAAGLHLPVAVRRRCAAKRSGRLRGHRLHGHRLGRVLPARRHSGASRRAGRGGRRRRGAIPLRLDGHRARPRRRTGRRRAIRIAWTSASPATRSC